MNKAELVEYLSLEAGLTKKDSSYYIDIILDGMKECLCRGEKVQLTGFGSFEVRERKAHEGFNPATGDSIQLSSVKAVYFRPGKDLKENL